MGRWNRSGYSRRLRNQAAKARGDLGPVARPTSNGRGSRRLVQRLERRRRRPYLPPRRGLVRRGVGILLSILVFLGVLGARTCRPIYTVTDELREQVRLDIIEGCRINNCTPEQLRSQLDQLAGWPRKEES